jgi:hypothetical protein
MYLIHAARDIFLVDEDAARATFPDQHRTKRILRHGDLAFREIEATGKKIKTQVWLFCREATNKRGRPERVRETVSLRGAQSNEQVRRIGEEDLARLAHYDELIAERQAALNVARDERSEFISKAWRRATKTVSAGELERLVARTEERDAAERAA